jgi:hypothetical protein
MPGTSLLNAIGAQTLTIRGSNKSSIGKLFEKLILGSLLSMLGFKHENSHMIGQKVFWLSTRDDKRESDATLLYDLGKGVRFDIGFIGRGNSEISLDKVTRYQHASVVGNVQFYMATIIIVDRIGARSNIVEMARQVNGHIVQMSATYWPQEVARHLYDIFGFEHELLNMEQSQIEGYLRDKLSSVPLESFLASVPVSDSSEEIQQMSFSMEEKESTEGEMLQDDEDDL